MSFLLALLVVGLIIYFIIHNSNRRAGVTESVSGSIGIGISKEDGTSQLLLLCSLALFGLALALLNDYLGRPVGMGAIAILVLLVALGVAYYSRLIALALIALGGIPIWWGMQSLIWIRDSEGRSVYMLAGFLMLSVMYAILGYAHKKSAIYERVAVIYSFIGGLGVTCILFLYSIKFMLASIFEHSPETAQAATWQIVTCIVVAALISVVALAYANFAKKISAPESIAAICFVALAAGLLALSGTMYLSDGTLSPTGTTWGLLLNFALILELLIWLFIGYIRQNAFVVNAGAAAIFVLLFIKYIDWFYHSLEKGLFFIGAGALLLLIGGAMEKGRRLMLDRMKTTV